MTLKKEARDNALTSAGLTARYHQRVHAFDATMKVAIEGAHDMAVRQCEAAAVINHLSTTLLLRAVAPSSVDGHAAASLEFTKQALEAAFAHTLALTEIAVKMQQLAVAALGNTASETLSDLVTLLPNGTERT